MTKFTSHFHIHNIALVFSKMYHSGKLLELSELQLFHTHTKRGNIFDVPGND